MPIRIFASCLIAVATLVAGAPAGAQAAASDPMVMTMQQGARHIRAMFENAAQQMTDTDYAFRPTPDVRTFGQLIAHVAETNYWFCSAAVGEKAPMSNIEKTRTAREDINQALLSSLAYCERSFAMLDDPAQRSAMRKYRETAMPANALLNYRNYHALLHWGNAITYMRLRGKVPPSAG